MWGRKLWSLAKEEPLMALLGLIYFFGMLAAFWYFRLVLGGYLWLCVVLLIAVTGLFVYAVLAL